METNKEEEGQRTPPMRSAGGPALAARGRTRHFSISFKLTTIVVAFTAAIISLLAVMEVSLNVSAGVRAYVQGEGLWSKGQKDGVYWLVRYLRTRDETDYRRYQEAIAAPLGDRQARLELDKPSFDPAVATRGFAAGNNAPSDIPAMIRLYRHLGHTPLFAPAIAIWADADNGIVQLTGCAEQIHAAIAGHALSAERQNALQAQLDSLNVMLTQQEVAFSTVFGNGGRQVQRVLTGLVLLSATLLLCGGLLVSWWIARGIRTSIERLRTGALRVAGGDLEQPIEVRGGDELAKLAAVFNDMMGHRRLVEAALRDATEFGNRVMQSATNSICVVDLQGRLTMVNRRTLEITGRSEDDLIGAPFAPLFVPEQRDALAATFNQVVHSGEPARDLEADVVRPDGSRVTILLSGSPLYKDNLVVAVVATAEDITERKRTEAFIRHSALHDSLTGLPNRTLLLERLETALRHARRGDAEVAVLLLDLDNFKAINDSFGHQVGDRLLVELAKLLQKCVRGADLVARLGGDEFVLVLTRVRRAEDLETVIAKVTAAVSTPILVDGHELVVTPSIGGCRFPGDGHDTFTLLKHADLAMYYAKAQGRSNMQWFSESMLRESRDKLSLGTALRRAIEHSELSIHYQPEISLRGGQVTGMEALMRWRNPVHGDVDPSRFIPVAEETGQILRLGDWALKTACAGGVCIEQRTGQSLQLAVNVSPRQFQRPDWLEVVQRTLGDTGFDPRRLELELTEGMLMRNPEESAVTLARLRRLGVTVVIDDFGTGYSSLSYLTRFPIDKIKIDRSFIRDLSTDAADAAVINAIIALAHSLDIRVIAEGVETLAQQTYLRERGCDEAQGFLYGAAVAAERFGAPPPEETGAWKISERS